MRSPSKKHSLRFIMVCVGIGSLVLAAIKTALVAVSECVRSAWRILRSQERPGS